MTVACPAPLLTRVRGAGGLWQIRRRSSATSVTLDVTTVFTFDGEGRLRSCLLDGVHHRRGFDGRVRARTIDGGPRRWLNDAQAQALMQRVHERLRGLREHLATRPDEAASRAAVDRLLSWDEARQAADVEAFRRLHRSVPILPPDRTNALLVQVTRGCAWNRCTFCHLYRDRHYEVLDTEALQTHLAEVRAFHGDGLRARRHLFLGDANLLGVSPARLRRLVAQVREAFPEPDFAEMAGFADVLGGARHAEDDLRALAGLGLRQLYLGLESGSDEVRRTLGKGGTAQDAVQTVARLHGAGLAVGIIVLLGAGGATQRARHVDETARLLQRMGLGPRDILFFSPLLGASENERAAQQEERQQLQSALPPPAEGGPKRALYDIEDFVY